MPLLLLLVTTLMAPLLPHAALAQPATGTIQLQVNAAAAPIQGVQILVRGTTHETNASGRVTITVPPGTVELTATKEGFLPATMSLEVAAGTEHPLTIELQPLPTVEEEVVVIASTRTDRRLEDQPMRVEVLGREEIEEKMLMTPGDIVMMMNEMGGMRVQTTSPSLGAASVRVQGMRGRYTRFLSDGLPLFGEVGGLGLLQIPPMDLAQVEVIKGVASSLYGAGAMGGVVNLISRRPGTEPVRELLINRSTRGGTDAVGFYAAPIATRWGLSLLGSGHRQERIDVNSDLWSDLPSYTRGVFRPRIFWDDGAGRTFFATTGVTIEKREGGTRENEDLPAAATPYVESLATRRIDAGAVGQLLLRSKYVLSARGAVSQHTHTHVFGPSTEDDRHNTAVADVAVRGTSGRHAWVAGAAVEYDAYRPIDLPQFTHSFTIPGVFAQDDVEITRWLSVSASARVDHHSEYGTFISPRIAGLLRAGGWASRLSLGTGFFGPSALTEETEAAGLSRLSIPQPLRAEEGRSASFDITRTDGPLSFTVTLFASRVRHPIDVERSRGFVLINATEPTTNTGGELLGTFRREPFAVTATYAYVRARESESDGLTLDAPLTPRHSAGVVGMWEREDVGRVGLEVYYTGIQRLEANPHATESEPYVIVGLLAERQFGRWRVFVNGENLTNVRQTRWQPLLRSDQAPDGRWTVDAWAPLEGRNVNGGLRVRF
jgi:outer membrane receptor for ferrienterochelin and colicins